MVPARVFLVDVRGGQAHFWTRKAFDRYLQGHEGATVEIVVRPRRKKPSVPMHRYYRGVLLPAIAEEVGESLLAMHRTLKYEFFASGRASLGRISKRLFLDYIEFCERVCAWLGLEMWPKDAIDFES